MKMILVFVLVFFSLTGSAQQATSASEMQIMMKMLSLKNSLIAKDSIVLSDVLADDVTYGHTNGMIQTKAQLISDIMSGRQSYKSIDVSDMNVRIFDHTAIVNLKSAVTMLYNENPLDLNMYITFVWIQKEGDWKLEARQV